jgi:hypothetical protein
MQEPKIANKNLDVLKPVLPTPWTRKQQAENAWRTSFLRPLQNTHFEDLAFSQRVKKKENARTNLQQIPDATAVLKPCAGAIVSYDISIGMVRFT